MLYMKSFMPAVALLASSASAGPMEKRQFPGLPSLGFPSLSLPSLALPTPTLPTPGVPTPALPTPGLPTLPAIPGLPNLPGQGLPTLTPAELVAQLATLTSQFQQLRDALAALKLGSGGLGGLLGGGLPTARIQEIITGLLATLAGQTTTLTALQGLGPITENPAQQAVCDAFAKFAETQQAVFDQLATGPASALFTTLYQTPIGVVLVSSQPVVAGLSNQIVNAVPFCAAGASIDRDELLAGLKAAICRANPLSGPLAGLLGGLGGLNIVC